MKGLIVVLAAVLCCARAVALMSMLTDVKMLDHNLHWVVPTGIGAAPPGLVEN